jgi:hypothetical protein
MKVRTFAEWIDNDRDCVPDDLTVGTKATKIGAVYNIFATFDDRKASEDIINDQIHKIHNFNGG